METKPSPTPSEKSSFRNRILIAAAIIVGLLVFGELWRRISQASELRGLEGQMGAQVTQLARESNQLDTQIAGAQSNEAVADWAHSQAKMVLPGDVLVMPLTPAAQIAPTPTPPPPSENLPNWKVWWEWLYGMG